MGCAHSGQTMAASSPAKSPVLLANNQGKNNGSLPKDTTIVLGKYYMQMTKADIMGEGTSSICRKGTKIDDAKPLAVKVYKSKKVSGTTLFKYKRQIEVLRELLLDFDKAALSKGGDAEATKRYWHERFDGGKTKPTDVFMELMDFSKDAKGVPGPDPKDNQLYVITEIAQYSMKDFFAQRRESKKQLSESSVKNIADAIILAMAGLHAKGFVHIDFKPENVMMFNGNLKVIDVDGCVKAGTKVAITDSSISFSPCYCAPEWAKFLIDESNQNIMVDRALDAWSTGMTICELITLDAVLKPMYASFLRNGNRNHQEAGFLFMEWLSTAKKPPTPKAVAKMKDFAELCNQLLNPLAKKRMSCAEALRHPYIEARNASANSTDLGRIFKEGGETITRQVRLEDDSDSFTHKGMLYKLNTTGDLMSKEHWLQRDMWLTPNGNVCYYSKKEDKRLVLIDSSNLHGCTVKMLKSGEAARDFAFSVTTSEEPPAKYYFSAEDQTVMNSWTSMIKKQSDQAADMMRTFRMDKIQETLAEFRITVKNRRMKVDAGDDNFEKSFVANLWKVKSDGDPKKTDDWFEREFWLTKNGSFVYHSERDNADRIYFTCKDVQDCILAKVPDDSSCKKFCFSIQLKKAASGGVEIEPAVFAAVSADGLASWFGKFKGCGASIS